MQGEFELVTLENLANIISAYKGSQIIGFFKKAGHPVTGGVTGSKSQFLCAAFEDMQQKHGFESINEFLKVVCNPQERIGKTELFDRTVERINEALAECELTTDNTGKVCPLPPSANASSHTNKNDERFDQRNFHPLVIEHSRQKFIDGKYVDALFVCCKAFDKFIQNKSGMSLTGVKLMSETFQKATPRLKLNINSVSPETQNDMQLGLMHLCMGLVSGVRNPTGHELPKDLPIGINDTLDIFSLVSYLLRQVDKCETP